MVGKGRRNPLTFRATMLRLQISVHHHAPHLSHQVKTQSVKPSSINVHLLWDRSRRPEGGEWKPIKNFFRNSNCRPMSQNRPNPQAFWPKFGVAIEKLTQQKRPRTSERNHEANRKRNRKTVELICLYRSDRCTGPVWPVTAVHELADRSDRSWLPVWPVLTTGLTGGTQKTPKIKIQIVNLEQMTSKSNET